jgi:hypothetical protein
LGGYFNSQWSFAWFEGPEAPSICCFGDDEKSIIIASSDGSFIRIKFDKEKGVKYFPLLIKG